MVNKSLIGVGILGLVAYLHYRSQRSNSISENNAIQKAFNLSELQGATQDLIEQNQTQLENLTAPVWDRKGRASFRANEQRTRDYQATKNALTLKIRQLVGFQESLNNDDSQMI